MDRSSQTSVSALSGLGKAMSDQTRVGMLLSLFDHPGCSLTVLARAAGVSSSTASEHLEILVNAGLVDRFRNGRQVAVALAGPEAASLVERLVLFSDVSSQHAIDCSDVLQGRFRPNSKMARIALARTCYDHLAGRLGVALADFLLRSQLVDTSFTPTSKGQAGFPMFST
jgi:DNA-binding transcriptional ArsR family regulator